MDLPYEIVTVILRYARLQCVTSRDYTNLLLISKKVKPPSDEIARELTLMCKVVEYDGFCTSYLPGGLKHGFFCEDRIALPPYVCVRVGYYNKGERSGTWKKLKLPSCLKMTRSNLLRLYNGSNWIVTITTYKDGRKHGDEVFYNNATGKVLKRCTYNNGSRVTKYIYADTYISKMYNYANGVKHGPCYYYYSNGIIFMRSDYQHGRKLGPWMKYDEEGRQSN